MHTWYNTMLLQKNKQIKRNLHAMQHVIVLL